MMPFMSCGLFSCRANNFSINLVYFELCADCLRIRSVQRSILLSRLTRYSPRLGRAGSGLEGISCGWLLSICFFRFVLPVQLNSHDWHLKYLISFTNLCRRSSTSLLSCKLLSKSSKKAGGGRRVAKKEAGSVFPFWTMYSLALGQHIVTVATYDWTP